MASDLFWWAALCCSLRHTRPSQHYSNSLHSQRRGYASVFATDAPQQIALFFLVDVVSLIYFLLWRRLATPQRRKVWNLLPRFLALIIIGCTFGIIAFTMRMQATALYFQSNGDGRSDRSKFELKSKLYQLAAGYLIVEAVEVLCLSVAKLFVLDRLRELILIGTQRLLAAADHPDCWYSERRLKKLGRRIVFSVAFLGLLGVIMNITGAAYAVQAGLYMSQAALACDFSGATTAAADALAVDSAVSFGFAFSFFAAQLLLEVLMWIVIIAAFACVGPLCIFILRRAHSFVSLKMQAHERRADAPAGNEQLLLRSVAQSASSQHRRIVISCVTVGLSFVPRIGYDIFYAWANQGSVYNGNCSICGPCQSVQWLATNWLFYTPEFNYSVIALSSPIPLAVSLWAMISVSDLRLLLARPSLLNDRIETGAFFARQRLNIDFPLQMPAQPVVGSTVSEFSIPAV